MKILLKNGNVVQDKVAKKDILIIDGYIKEVSDKINIEDVDEVVDCSDKYVMPGLIDMHVHLREPGFEYKEDLVSGATAAIYGGVTTLCCMPNTAPVLDNGSIISWIRKRSDEIGLADILPFGSVTKGMKGEELTEMGDLIKSGACALSDDGVPVMNSEVMRRALEYSRYFGSFVAAHEEDINLFNGGSVHEGIMSYESGLQGSPAEAEAVMIARDLQLARLTGGHVHICHISSKYSVELIRQAKNDGINVTGEVTPNHLFFTDAICASYDTNTKINPPIREEEDRQALIEGIKDGTIDCIATDHAPHHIDDKFKEYDLAAYGMLGLQLTVPIMLTLIEKGILSWVDFARLASTSPAKVLKLSDRGSIKSGLKADIAIIDPSKKYIYDDTINRSKSKNSVFYGKELTGIVFKTIKNGKILF